MKIATYNVNGVNGRLPVLLHCLDTARPDVVCLQELKAQQAHFPAAAIRDADYNAVWLGQKSLNGVAILARDAEIHETLRGAARRSRPNAEPLHRSRCERGARRKPLPAKRQPGSGPEV